MSKRRAYIINPGREPADVEAFTGLKRLIENSEFEFEQPYNTIKSQLYRAKQLTGKAVVRVKGKDGKDYTIQVKDLK